MLRTSKLVNVCNNQKWWLFLVAPSRRAERLIWSLWCPDVCMLVCLLACLFVGPLTFRTKFRKFHRISKIPKRDHVSRHSEQLWFFDPPPNFIGSQKFQNKTMFHAFLSNFDFLTPPPTVKDILENTRFGLTYVRTENFFFQMFFNSNFFSSNFFTISHNELKHLSAGGCQISSS